MILLSEAASTDIKSTYMYLNTESPKAARQLLNSIDLAFSMLMEFPNIRSRAKLSNKLSSEILLRAKVFDCV